MCLFWHQKMEQHAYESCVISIYWNLVAPSTQLSPSSAEFGDLNLVLPTVVSLKGKWEKWVWPIDGASHRMQRGLAPTMVCKSADFTCYFMVWFFLPPKMEHAFHVLSYLYILVLLQLLCFWCIYRMSILKDWVIPTNWATYHQVRDHALGSRTRSSQKISSVPWTRPTSKKRWLANIWGPK